MTRKVQILVENGSQYFVWPLWAAITAAIHLGIDWKSLSRYSGVMVYQTLSASFLSAFLKVISCLQTAVISK